VGIETNIYIVALSISKILKVFVLFLLGDEFSFPSPDALTSRTPMASSPPLVAQSLNSSW